MVSKAMLTAGVIVLALFLGSACLLILTNHSSELRGLLLLVGQGLIGGFNAYLIFRNSGLTKASGDHLAHRVKEVQATVDEVKDAVNGSG